MAHFLRCVGRAAARNIGRALASLVPLGEVSFEVARDACEEYRRDRSEAVLHSLARQNTVRQADRRITLQGPAGDYLLGERIGVGDVADVYFAQAPDGQACLLKVARTIEGNARLDNERRALGELIAAAGETTYRHYLPTLTTSFATVKGPAHRTNVFHHDAGLWSLEQVHAQRPVLDGRHLGWVFKRLLTVLGLSHQCGWLHGAVLPCHVLVRPADHGLRLIGWGQSARVGRPLPLVPRWRDWMPPDVLRGRAVGPATDLFLAARCMLWLAGEGPGPDVLPPAMARFFQSCLLESPAMRPDDAWQLTEEFDDLLKRLYGSPKFHPLFLT